MKVSNRFKEWINSLPKEMQAKFICPICGEVAQPYYTVYENGHEQHYCSLGHGNKSWQNPVKESIE